MAAWIRKLAVSLPDWIADAILALADAIAAAADEIHSAAQDAIPGVRCAAAERSAARRGGFATAPAWPPAPAANLPRTIRELEFVPSLPCPRNSSAGRTSLGFSSRLLRDSLRPLRLKALDREVRKGPEGRKATRLPKLCRTRMSDPHHRSYGFAFTSCCTCKSSNRLAAESGSESDSTS